MCYNFNEETILNGVSRHFTSLFLPVLTRMKDHNWGKITADGQKMTRDGELIKMDFLGKISSFTSILTGAQESINEKVILRPCEKYDLSAVQSVSDFQSTAATSVETVAAIEDTVRDWYDEWFKFNLIFK